MQLLIAPLRRILSILSFGRRAARLVTRRKWQLHAKKSSMRSRGHLKRPVVGFGGVEDGEGVAKAGTDGSGSSGLTEFGRREAGSASCW